MTLKLEENISINNINDYIKNNISKVKYSKINSKIKPLTEELKEHFKEENILKKDNNQKENIHKEDLNFIYNKKIKDLEEKNNKLKKELSLLKEKIEDKNKKQTSNYKIWHLFLVSLIFFFLGGLLKKMIN